MRFVLRGASAADVGGLLALWVEAAENDSRPPDTSAAVTALLERDPDAVILAEHDGELIGSIIAGWDGWRCHLYRLAVRRLAEAGGRFRASQRRPGQVQGPRDGSYRRDGEAAVALDLRPHLAAMAMSSP